MARFIRGKVKKGEYTNISEVVRDAVRRLQEAEAAKAETLLRVRQGLKDIDSGRYEEFDAAGLRGLATTLVGASVRKTRRSG